MTREDSAIIGSAGGYGAADYAIMLNKVLFSAPIPRRLS